MVTSTNEAGDGDFNVRVKLMAAAALVVALVSGCDRMNPFGSGVSDPLTPEESKAQVMDAAREIVRTLDIEVKSAFFRPASCNDQGEPPFRGRIVIRFPKAASFEESDREIAEMVQRLKNNGWETPADFHTHGSALQKNNVTAEIGGQTVSSRSRSIHILGECRDMTTPKGHYPTEPIDLS